ncbi:MAG: hypothetical protein GY697_15155, partial [Desulfobacterales bacterium]|nr:hypothetical protein [Desulfobacterales bacterium]
VLEQSIRADASSLEQQILLLDLYRKTDNRARFSAFFSTLDEGAMLNPKAWQEMADHFGIED